jgi:diguanylate cyclase (GGDEF)-like protein
MSSLRPRHQGNPRQNRRLHRNAMLARQMLNRAGGSTVTVKEERDMRRLWRDGQQSEYDVDVRHPSAAVPVPAQIEYAPAARPVVVRNVEFMREDRLTGLLSRDGLYTRLRTKVAAAKAGAHAGFAIALINLDEFRFVNYCLGFETGDALLKVVAARLRGCLADRATLARQGGDEFAILIDSTCRATIAATMERILAAVSSPVPVDGGQAQLTCSIGISCYPEDGEDPQTLLMHAETARQGARALGRNSFHFHAACDGGRETSSAKLAMEASLRLALARKEFYLEYQPQISLVSGRTVGTEALIRWKKEGKEIVPPGEFIPLCEELGLIVPIGEWVLRTACAQNKAWQDAGLPPACVSVNLSARQFAQPGLAQSIAHILEETGLEARYLDVEITESMMMQDVAAAIATMQELKAMGVRISVDDFGTGYSSLGYLKQFPLDVLKIDRMFVAQIDKDWRSGLIASAIISLAHALNLQVIAEGVETQVQASYLRRRRCDQVQGYYFSRPVSADECARLLQRNLLRAPSTQG